MKRHLNILFILVTCASLLLTSCTNNAGSDNPDNTVAYSTDGSVGEYSITYTVNGETYLKTCYDSGDPVIEPLAPSVTGYTFDGWTPEIPSVMPSEDLIITAQLTPNKYTLRYVVNEEEFASVVYSYGDKIILPDYPYDTEENVFSGWTNTVATMPANDYTIIGYLYESANVTNIDLGTLDDGSVYEITASGMYMLSGTATDTSVNINIKDGNVVLLLNNASVSCLGSGAAIQCTNGDSVVIQLMSGTVNTICDTVQNSLDGAINIKSADLTIEGEGTLNITSSESGIYNTKCFKISGGVININSGGHGIEVKNSVIISGGDICICSQKDGIQSKGDTDDTDGTLIDGTGTISIDKGSIDIISGQDGISAEGALCISDNAEIYVNAGSGVNGAVKYDDDGSETSQKGIKTASVLTVTGSELNVESYESSLKAASVDISGGSITLKTMKHGISSDSEINISGGIIDICTLGTSLVDSSSSVSSSQFGFGAGSTNSDGYSKIASKGIKSDSDMIIKGGTVNISSTGHAVQSAGTLTIDGLSTVLNINAYCDSIRSNAKGLTSDGILTVNNGSINILRSYEGIESKKAVYVNGGDIHITATDDGINAASATVSQRPVWGAMGSGSSDCTIAVNGGFIFLCSNGDGIDSNGSLSVTDGILISASYSGGNSCLDNESGFTFTGGIVIGLAPSNSMWSECTNGLSSGSYLFCNVGTISADSIVSVCDSSKSIISALKLNASMSNASVIYLNSTLGNITDYKTTVGGTCSVPLNTFSYCDEGTVSGGSSYSHTASVGSGGGMGGGMGGGFVPGRR